MPTKKYKKLSVNDLIQKGYGYAIAIGILAGAAIISNGNSLEEIKNYLENTIFFPKSGYVQTVEDGDTFTLKSGVKVRLIGIDSPDRGQKNFDLARNNLTSMVKNKKIYLEYDRYQDDKFGRVVAWVWVDCEKAPSFEESNYMHKSNNESNPGLTENPEGCKKEKLVNEELLKQKSSVPMIYKDRGELKYQKRLAL